MVEMLAVILLLLPKCKYLIFFKLLIHGHYYRMAVAASDSTDTVAYFSDTGECVEIIAPVSSSSTCAHTF